MDRGSIDIVEWDAAHNNYKVNPLANWTFEQVQEFVKENEIPYNELHDKGYPSLGCAPCTRAIKPGEDIRAGRWRWECDPNAKECGIHIVAPIEA
jgi:phosphoadenosine phosphosulfate reductase